MNELQRAWLWALPLCWALGGCGRPPQWNQQPVTSGPFRVGDRALWLETTTGTVYALDPAATPLRMRTTKVATDAVYAQPTPAHDALLVLTPGHEAIHVGDVEEAPSLWVISPGQGDGDPQVLRSYDLDQPFDRLSVSADGTRAVAFYGQNGAPTGTYFRNPNELAIVDLTADPGANNPAFRTIRSLGAAPLDVDFSPPLEIPPGSGQTRTLAVVPSVDYLTFLDLSHLDRPEITVPLTSLDSGQTVTPKQLVFAPDSATLFVRADGSADVFGIALEPHTQADPGDNDYAPRINQPSAGKVASDMVLLHDPSNGGRTLILTANQSQDLSLIDAETSEFQTIPMGVPVDSLLPVPADNPTSVIVYSRQEPQSFVHFLGLANLSSRLAANLQRRDLAEPVHDLVPVPGGNQLLVLHDDSRTVVSILDLGPRRTDAPIEGLVPLGSFDFVGGAYLVGVTSGLKRMGVLDLATLNTYDLRLDEDPQKVLAVGSHLVIDHPTPGGEVTVVPDPTATREDSQVLWGFLLGNVLSGNGGE